MPRPTLFLSEFIDLVALASGGTDMPPIEGFNQFDPRFSGEGPTGIIVSFARSDISALLRLAAVMGAQGFDASFAPANVPGGMRVHLNVHDAAGLAVVFPATAFADVDLAAAYRMLDPS